MMKAHNLILVILIFYVQPQHSANLSEYGSHISNLISYNSLDNSYEFEVQANQTWQNTKIPIQKNDKVSIQYLSGKWTYWKGNIPYADAAGVMRYTCAKQMQSSQCVEPIPSYWVGGLIGKVGNQLLEIGNSMTFTARGKGTLYLRINDGDEGLFDNAGSVRVKITIESNKPPVDSTPAKPTNIPNENQKKIINVYMIIFDPIINGKSLTKQAGFNDPIQLSDTFTKDVYTASGQTILYKIKKISSVKQFPEKQGGFVFTPEKYYTCLNSYAGTAPEYCNKMVNYEKVVTTTFDENYLNACEAVKTDGIDEVWEWEGGWLGFWKFNVIAPNSLCPGLNKQFTYMTFNYSRGNAEMLESLAHRSETMILDKIGISLWDRFDGQRERYKETYDQPSAPDVLHPEVNKDNAHCGNVHFPPNAFLHYQYGRRYPVISDCEDWMNYPLLHNTKTKLDCDIWGCSHYGYMKWWLNHLPHNSGMKKEILNNWWYYVFP